MRTALRPQDFTCWRAGSLPGRGGAGRGRRVQPEVARSCEIKSRMRNRLGAPSSCLRGPACHRPRALPGRAGGQQTPSPAPPSCVWLFLPCSPRSRSAANADAGGQAGSGQEGGTRSAPWTGTQAGAALASSGSFIHPGVGRHPRQKSARAGQGSLLGTLAWGLSARAHRVVPMLLLNRGWQKSRLTPAAH